MIKFLTAGNVDDGKSSLIGRLLYDSNSLFEDQIEEVKRSTDESFGEDLDFSLFLDGLISERKQKITIDVAYRYFSYDNKKFIIADAPGHEEYTRNMAVAAANSDVIVILIDVSKKIKPQTLRHSYIANLFGIKKVIVAVNKMDLVDYSEAVFNEIKAEYLDKIEDLDFKEVDFVPVSSINGENVVNGSANMNWYKGKTVMEFLNDEKNEENEPNGEFRLLVQNVVKHENRRLYQGILSNGEIEVGQEVLIYPSQKLAKIVKIIKAAKEVKDAVKGDSISFELDQDIDLERGGVVTITTSKDLIFSNKLQANLIWFDSKDFNKKDLPKNEFIVKISHNYGLASIEKLNGVTDLANGTGREDKDLLKLNQIANIDLSLSKKIAFDKFTNNKLSGSFLLINPVTNETVACGIIDGGLEDKVVDSGDKNVEEFLKDVSILIKKYFPDSDLSAENFLEKIYAS